MAVKLRLMRMGKTKQPTYRLVAADSRSPRDGRFIEIVGSYAPREQENKVVLKEERVTRWLKEGAQPTDRVRRILVGAGLLEAEPVRQAPAAKKAEKATPAEKATAAEKAEKPEPAPKAEEPEAVEEAKAEEAQGAETAVQPEEDEQPEEEQ